MPITNIIIKRMSKNERIDAKPDILVFGADRFAKAKSTLS